MSNTLYARTTLGNIADLTTPSSTQKYVLGEQVLAYDSDNKVIAKYEYVKSHGTLGINIPYVIVASSTAGSEVITAAPFTLAAPGLRVCVPQVAFTSGYYGFVLIQGIGDAIMTAETYAVGDHLQVLNAGVAMVVDGSTGSTTYSVNTCAICKEAGTTAVAKSIYLINRQAVCAAS